MRSSLKCQAESSSDIVPWVYRATSLWTLLKYLESIHPRYSAALPIPPYDDDMILIGGDGPTYLFPSRLSNQNSGALRERPNIATARDMGPFPGRTENTGN